MPGFFAFPAGRSDEERLINAYRPTSVIGEQAPAPTGELVRLEACVSGETQVADIPLAPGVDLETLKAGDSSPLEVVVEVPAGRSRRGWFYTPQCIKAIVGEVATNTAAGYLGHQDPERVEREFLPPVTHWVGARWEPDAADPEKGKGLFRGVIDAASTDLKRWVKSRRITQVSIFGRPELTQVRGETHVTNYQLLSIDWTPLSRAGMPTRIVALGEMDSTTNVKGAAPKGSPGEEKKPVTLEEALAELRKVKATPGQVLGEMGWQPADVLATLNVNTLAEFGPRYGGEAWTGLQADHAALGEVATVYALGSDATPAAVVAAAKAGAAAIQQAKVAERDALLTKVVGEQVAAEHFRPLVRQLAEAKIAEGADEAAIKVVVGEIAGAEPIKGLLAGAGSSGTTPAPQSDNRSGGGEGTGGERSGAYTAPEGLIIRRVGI